MKTKKSNLSKDDKMSKFLYDNINNTTMVMTCDYIQSYSNSKDEWVFHLNYKDNKIILSYNKIWLVFELKYKLSYTQIQAFVGNWIEKNCGWKGFTPHHLGQS